MSSQLNEILGFINEEHRNQTRRYSDDPYTTHPLLVASFVDAMHRGSSKDAVKAAYFHDVLEDGNSDRAYREAMIYHFGGDNVISIVDSVSHRTRNKYDTLSFMQSLDMDEFYDTWIVFLGDKYANALSLYTAIREYEVPPEDVDRVMRQLTWISDVIHPSNERLASDLEEYFGEIVVLINTLVMNASFNLGEQIGASPS